MVEKLEFKRDARAIWVVIDSSGVSITWGWSVGISPETALRYVEHFNKIDNEGFVRHRGGVVLVHGPARIEFTETEAADLMARIEAVLGAAKH